MVVVIPFRRFLGLLVELRVMGRAQRRTDGDANANSNCDVAESDSDADANRDAGSQADAQIALAPFILFVGHDVSAPWDETYDAVNTARMTMNQSATAEITYKTNLSGMKLNVQWTRLCNARNAKNAQAAPTYVASTLCVT